MFWARALRERETESESEAETRRVVWGPKVSCVLAFRVVGKQLNIHFLLHKKVFKIPLSEGTTVYMSSLLSS